PGHAKVLTTQSRLRSAAEAKLSALLANCAVGFLPGGGAVFCAVFVERQGTFCRDGKGGRSGRTRYLIPTRDSDVESLAENRHVAHVGVEPADAQARRGRSLSSPYGRRDSLHSERA